MYTILNILTRLSISAAVVSNPVNNDQSFTTAPAPNNTDPLFNVAGAIGIYNKLANSSYSVSVVLGLTTQPKLFIKANVDTKVLLATVDLNTSTPKTSLIISSTSFSISGLIIATLSLTKMLFPKAVNLLSTLFIFISSGNEFLIYLISSSEVILGNNKPFLLPAHNLPIILNYPI